MGMPISIDVRDELADEALLDSAFDWLREVDQRFSTYKSESEISRLNRGELTLDAAHQDVRDILVRCEQLRFETGGYFDARAVDRQTIDPSGLVKGWSVDRAGELLEAGGARNYAINAGGDVRVRGRPDPDPVWRIGIRHPFEHDKVAAVLGVTDTSVATSGTYERGEHIINPHTGQPPSGVLSVTIVGPDLGTADAYATAAFAMGPDGADWAARLPQYEAMIILSDSRVLSTPGLPRLS